MSIQWGRVLRDVALVFLLTFFGGFIVGASAQLAGKTPPPGGIALSNLLFGTLGFLISGCFAPPERFKHLTIVALGAWLSGIVNVFFGVPIIHWVGSILFTFLVMGLGGSLSFLLVPGPNPYLKRCPYCAEEIRIEARLCRHCGRELGNSPSPESV